MNYFSLINEIKKNAVNYFLIIFVLVTAVVSGFVVANNINSKTDNSISEYLCKAFESLKSLDGKMDSNAVLYNIILQNIVVFGIMIMLGMIRFGFVFVYPIILFKGIVLGFAYNIIISAFDFLNAVKIIFIILPSMLIMLFLLISCACKSIKYSLSKSVYKTGSIINYDDKFVAARSYYLGQLKCVFPMFVACLWDSYAVVWILT